MGKDDYGPISQYNSLIDPNLQGYYSKTIVRHHLRQTGLINRRGEIIPDDVWRKKIHTKERMEQASRLIASKIVQQAIEIKNLERAEIRRKLEEVSKKELVKKIRGTSLQNRQLPLLWSNKDDSYTEFSSNKRAQSRSISPKNEDYDIRVVNEEQDYDHRVFIPKPPKQKPLKKIRFRRRVGTANRFSRGCSSAPKPEPILITMIYYGKGIKIPFDTQVFDSKDEINIYQQHCGGENLLVYSGLHEKGDKFSFHSKRHKEFPFGLTIFLNGKYDCRISTCCEYRHNLNVRIGINGSFGITNVVGGHPCVKCLWEKNQKAPKKIIKPVRDVGTIDNNPIKQKEESDEDIDIVVEKPVILQPNKEDYDEDFNEGDDWIIKVYTSDIKGKTFEGTDSKVYISLIGTRNETEKFYLNKSNVKSKNKDLFEVGNVDEFQISSNVDLDKLHQIRIGHDNNGLGAGWHLEKIEVINKRDGTLYIFLCNRWLARNEDDHKIERILPEPKTPTKPNIRLKIEMKHDDVKVQSKTTTPAESRTPSPVKNRTPTPKMRTPSPDSISSRSPTPIPTYDNNNRRWTASDVIKIVKEEDQASVRSNTSKSSNGSSIKSKSSKQNRTPSQQSKKSSVKKSSSSESSTSSESSSSEESNDDKEKEERTVKSVYDQVNEEEEKYSSMKKKDSVSSRNSRADISIAEKKQSRDNSNESRKSKASISKDRVDSKQSNRSVTKDFISESKTSLASSKPESRNSILRDEQTSRNSTSKDSKSDSRLSKNSTKSERKSLTDKNSNESMTSLNSEKYSNDWIIKVHTSDLKSKIGEGTDSVIYISLIGSSDETKKVILSKRNAVPQHKNLFEGGNIDEFQIITNIQLDKVQNIRIGHDNSGLAAGWYLNKVEVINRKDNTLYSFPCNKWLAKDEDDGKIERVLGPNDGSKSSINVKSKTSLDFKEPEIAKSLNNSRIFETGSSRPSSAAGSYVSKKSTSSSSDSDSDSSDSDDSDDDTAKEEAEEEPTVKKSSSRLSNQSATNVSRKPSVTSAVNKNGGSTINLIQELIQKDDTKSSQQGSKTSLRSLKDKASESRNSSRLSNKEKSIVSVKTDRVIPAMNIIGSSDVDETKSTTSMSKMQTNMTSKSNSSLQSKKETASNGNTKVDTESDSESETDSEVEKSKNKKANVA